MGKSDNIVIILVIAAAAFLYIRYFKDPLGIDAATKWAKAQVSNLNPANWSISQKILDALVGTSTPATQLYDPSGGTPLTGEALAAIKPGQERWFDPATFGGKPKDLTDEQYYAAPAGWSASDCRLWKLTGREDKLTELGCPR